MARVYNFNPGPATLPLPALQKCQVELPDYMGTGMSILETSHRSKQFETVLSETQDLFKELMGIPDNYKIIFLGGGASLQFAMIPMNFIPKDGSADYVITGRWAKNAIKEANIIAKGNVAGSSEDENFTYIPEEKSLNLNSNAAYLHITSNNTIFGTQWQAYPDSKGLPLVADFSSDILSRQIDVSKFAMIYAGAQKNLGPAGVTVVIVRDDFTAKANQGLPTMLSYATHIEKNSLFNTPPVFAIYMIYLVLQWVKENGGLAKMEKVNRQKMEMVYQAIDNSNGFYRGTVRQESRSWMNATMRLDSEELENEFISQAKEAGLVGLKGHRSVGGIRISMYNAMPIEGIEKLTALMKNLKNKN